MDDTSLPESAFRWAATRNSSPNDPLLVARFSRPRSHDPTTIAVLADSHLTLSDNGTWKVYHRTQKRLQDAIIDINRRATAGVFIAGDLTKDGTESQFQCARELLDMLQHPVVAIPGNHDVRSPGFDTHPAPPIVPFGSEFACGVAPFANATGAPHPVGLDSATATEEASDHRHRGHISADQLSWIGTVLRRVECPIVVSHHNLTDRFREISPNAPDIYQLSNAEAVATTLSESGVELLVSGHAHYPTVARAAGIREIIVPATSSFPQGYALVHVGPDGTEVEFVPIADRAGLKEAWRFARADDREFLLRAATMPYPIFDE
jgi:3',5'-cyclic AMP phosphodiesterase CpdA